MLFDVSDACVVCGEWTQRYVNRAATRHMATVSDPTNACKFTHFVAHYAFRLINTIA